MALSFEQFPSLDQLRHRCAGGILGGAFDHRGMDLHGKTLTFTAPVAVVSFVKPSLIPFTFEEIRAAVAAVDPTLLTVIVDGQIGFRANVAVTLGASGSAAETAGRAVLGLPKTAMAGTIINSPSGATPRYIDIKLEQGTTRLLVIEVLPPCPSTTCSYRASPRMRPSPSSTQSSTPTPRTRPTRRANSRAGSPLPCPT
jgi:hypothetical protein